MIQQNRMQSWENREACLEAVVMTAKGKNGRTYTKAVPYTGQESWDAETVKGRTNKPEEIPETSHFKKVLL